MPRDSRRVVVREVGPDERYQSVFIALFIRMLMKHGKKTQAANIVYKALLSVSEKINEDPVEIINKVVESVRPSVQLCSRRIGGATYRIPVEVRPKRGVTLAFRWIRNSARARPGGTTMAAKLAYEILDALNGRGGAIKIKEDTHKMAESNKAFSHFRLTK